MSDWTQINRDPFARRDLLRRTVDAPGGCTECGGHRWRRGRPITTLFEYAEQNDGLSTRVIPITGAFDRIDCMRQYHR